MEALSISSLKQYLYVLNHHHRKLFFIVIGFVFLSLMEVIGLGLVGPFVAAMIDPTVIRKSKILLMSFQKIGINTEFEMLSGLGIAVMTFYFLKNYYNYKIQSKVYSFNFNFRSDLIERLMSVYLAMPYDFYLHRSASSLTNIVIAHTKNMTDDLLLPSLKLISDVIVLIALVAFLLILSPLAASILTSILIFTVFVYAKIVKPMTKKYGQYVLDSNQNLIKGVNQSVGAVKEWKVLSAEKMFFDFISRATRNTAENQTAFYSLMLIPRYMIEVIFIFFLVAYSIFIRSYFGPQDNLISILTVLALAGMRLIPLASGISSSINSINYSKHALLKVYEDLKLLEGKESIFDQRRTRTKSNNGSFYSLSLNSVSYSYPHSNTPAIDRLTLHVEKGESIGIIGKSGAGKTTLIDVLLGMHMISQGEIYINGENVDSFGWSKWLNNVAYLPQTPFMLDSTIAENVAFGVHKDDINPDKIMEAIKFAQLSDFLERMPKGIFTELGEGAIRLSGGEKQRIALARAFYQDKSIYILDEATSALDNETESVVVEIIKGLQGIKTVIVIAHRISTIKYCDKIYKLEGGRILKSGTFSQIFD